MGILAKFFSAIGGMNIISSSADTACWLLFVDEPECPKCIVEK